MFTGRLTPTMLDDVFREAKKLAGIDDVKTVATGASVKARTAAAYWRAAQLFGNDEVERHPGDQGGAIDVRGPALDVLERGVTGSRPGNTRLKGALLRRSRWQ